MRRTGEREKRCAGGVESNAEKLHTMLQLDVRFQLLDMMRRKRDEGDPHSQHRKRILKTGKLLLLLMQDWMNERESDDQKEDWGCSPAEHNILIINSSSRSADSGPVERKSLSLFSWLHVCRSSQPLKSPIQPSSASSSHVRQQFPKQRGTGEKEMKRPEEVELLQQISTQNTFTILFFFMSSLYAQNS